MRRVWKSAYIIGIKTYDYTNANSRYKKKFMYKSHEFAQISKSATVSAAIFEPVSIKIKYSQGNYK